ncbi:MAG TPA: protein-L-isoaspartate(D-aspartate) O-methyltransferase, partial [Bacteroidia bacterium]|nr:protein-L-isoaspartate(D-aspartate) O-methyltransferase [Bacteroidia bacterium]
RTGGIMVIPIGEGEQQEMYILRKTSDSTFERQVLGKFKFVPLLQNKA